MDNIDQVKGTILIIDDDFDFANLTTTHLKNHGHTVYVLNEPVNYLSFIEEKEIETVLLDVMIPAANGFDILKKIRHRFPSLPVIMTTALQSAHPAVTAMKIGAFDYIPKPDSDDDFERLNLVVRNAVSIYQSTKELDRLRGVVEKKYSFSNIIGTSKAMRDVFYQIEKVAESNINVLIFGESGTGKELIARAIHHNGPRKKGPFADLNCAAVAYNLIESELFGHEKGAFTGAYTQKAGKFQQANGGTLFLDEIGEMPTPIQVKILRAIQERSFERVGGEKKIFVDVRIISATNKNLKQEVQNKNFREDLFYRISGFPIHLKPLRERIEDIPLLVNHFIQKFSKEMNKQVVEVHPAALTALKLYSWPGNVRELENVIQRAIVLTDKSSKKIHLDNLPLEIQNMVQNEDYDSTREMLSSIRIGSNQMPSFEEIEKRVILEALTRCDGNVTLAAEQLKIGRATIYRKIEKYGIKAK
ncbi:response regulator [candidate division KSB1 bacterium]|nr:response regulator [candidate division KSB1 bacterium]